MPKMSAQETAAKWQSRFAASGDAYAQGVNRVQENPMQLAVQAQDRLLANFTTAVTSGKWARNTGNTSMAQWKQACVDKGKAALATSARLGAEKYARKEAVLGPIRDQIKASLPARGTVEQNLERARLMALGMHEASLRG